MYEGKQILPGIDVASSSRVKGLWASQGKQTIGIVEEEGVGPYLVIWKDMSTHNLPLAVTADGVQLPREKGSDTYRFIDWDTLFEMVEAHKAAQVPTPV